MSTEQQERLEQAVQAGFAAVADALGAPLVGIDAAETGPSAEIAGVEGVIGNSAVSVKLDLEGETPDSTVEPSELAGVFLAAAAGELGEEDSIRGLVQSAWQATIGDAIVTVAWSRQPAADLAEEMPETRSTSASAAPPELKRLAGVMLDVAVELGRTRVPIKELLSLDQGGVIKLGKPLNEPVELVVNGLPTARGEMVVVDGRLGLKITELID